MKQWWGTAHGFTLQEVKGIITPQMPQGFQAKPDYNNLDILRQTEVLF